MRKHPLIVFVQKASPVKVLHISNENSKDFTLGVRTECGRNIRSVSMYDGDPDSLSNPDSDGLVTERYDFEGKYKLCRHCGNHGDFSEAQRESIRIRQKIKEERELKNKAIEELLANFECAIRATMIATMLPEGAEDVKNEGFGITFTHNGVRFKLSVSEEEEEKLKEIARVESCL